MLAGRGGPSPLPLWGGGVAATSRVSDCALALDTPAAIAGAPERAGGDCSAAATAGGPLPLGCRPRLLGVCGPLLKPCVLFCCGGCDTCADMAAAAVAEGAGLRWAVGESKDTVTVMAATSARLSYPIVRLPSASYSVGGSVRK